MKSVQRLRTAAVACGLLVACACARSGFYNWSTDAGGGDRLTIFADAGTGDSSSGDDAGDGSVVDGPVPPSPLQIVTTPDSESSFSVFWLGGGADAVAHRLAWTEGTLPPADCDSGTVVADGLLTGDRHQISGGLQPWTDYSVRLCAVSNRGVLSAESLTATQRTLPACDQTVTANETFVEFQTRIDAALDNNGDGRRTICIADGVEIATRAAVEGSTLTLGGGADFTTLRATRGDDARIVNYRTDATGFPTMSALRVWQGEQAQLANLRLEAFGTDGECIDGQLADGSVGFMEISNIDCLVHGDSAHALDFTSRPTGAIKDVRITVDGPSSVALVFGGAGQSVDDLARFSIELSTGCSNTGCAFDLNPGADFGRIRWGTISGVLSNGFVWDLATAHVGEIEDVTFTSDRPAFRIDTSTIETMRRLRMVSGLGAALWLRNSSVIDAIVDSTVAITSAASAGVRLDSGSSVGAMRNLQLRKDANAGAVDATALIIADDAWVVSDQVNRVTVCTEVGAAQAWEAHGTSAANGLLEGSGAVPPSAHVPFVAGDVLGAQTFPFESLDGSGAQGGAVAAQDIVLGGVCP